MRPESPFLILMFICAIGLDWGGNFTAARVLYLLIIAILSRR